MQTIKYPVKEVDISAIPKNRTLSLSITQTQKALCEQSIRQYGLLTPIVLMENPSGELFTLAGENELEILKEMKVAKADVFVTKLQNRKDTCKVILLLSSLQKGLNPLSEGLVLRELMKSGVHTQQELAASLLKSKSWVSKRLSLAEELSENVAEMVLAKQLCSASAQEIARLPQALQHQFAMEVYSKSLPKSTVERLVTAYNGKTTPKALKKAIISNPALAAETVNPLKLKQCTKAKEEISSRFDASIRLLLRLVAETEACLSSMTKEEVKKYERLLPVVNRSMGRFIKLAEYLVSPGKDKGGVEGDH
ncbi:MAG: ParB/RepB/Spo0J family partition protein [Syntrophales bacterium]|nr:ParB/RepB/Spo0J family partition protein [Syntrophales bacterium]